ncbi:GTP-binding protein [Paenibacillus sp. F411]|uniref:CobW family GTP-binding protein n=1 Tax=Paenibacillus sp. F411 TaxID=2820239 RepID=UPI001AB0014A|nr:GTP-binding protein [Paenibacillus sp. F411]MBO2944281.1 GTP-binding protein [Paenibacillus sp. F411]
MTTKVPIVILSGFLGSGKTTLLTKMLQFYTSRQLTPAVIMNEVGDVNLDGLLVGEDIAMREMLSGCICCSISGDLGLEIRDLIQEASPDLILVEATGVANPMETFDAVTDAAILIPIEMHAMVSVVDANHFLHWHRKGKGRTYHLMMDQIRCASILLLNKSDLISPAELDETRQLLVKLNPHAAVHVTTYCQIEDELLEQVLEIPTRPIAYEGIQKNDHAATSSDHDHHSSPEQPDHHHTHSHVMAYTYYFEQPIDQESFTNMITQLPKHIYRAKGVYTAADTGERMLFQYAYQKVDTFRINPQGKVEDVAAFIGEQFSKDSLKKQLDEITSYRKM